MAQYRSNIVEQNRFGLFQKSHRPIFQSDWGFYGSPNQWNPQIIQEQNGFPFKTDQRKKLELRTSPDHLSKNPEGDTSLKGQSYQNQNYILTSCIDLGRNNTMKPMRQRPNPERSTSPTGSKSFFDSKGTNTLNAAVLEENFFSNAFNAFKDAEYLNSHQKQRSNQAMKTQEELKTALNQKNGAKTPLNISFNRPKNDKINQMRSICTQKEKSEMSPFSPLASSISCKTQLGNQISSFTPKIASCLNLPTLSPLRNTRTIRRNSTISYIPNHSTTFEKTTKRSFLVEPQTLVIEEEDEGRIPVLCINCGEHVMAAKIDNHTLSCLKFKNKDTIKTQKIKNCIEEKTKKNEELYRVSLEIVETVKSSLVIQSTPSLVRKIEMLQWLLKSGRDYNEPSELRKIVEKLKELDMNIGQAHHEKQKEVLWLKDTVKKALILTKKKQKSILKEEELELSLSEEFSVEKVRENRRRDPFVKENESGRRISRDSKTKTKERNQNYFESALDHSRLSEELFRRSHLGKGDQWEREDILFECPDDNKVVSSADDKFSRENAKRDFYSLAIQEKLKLPQGNPNKNQDIGHMFHLVMQKGIPRESWAEFISCCFEC